MTIMYTYCTYNCVCLQLAPTKTESLLTAMKYVKNPRKACEILYQQVKTLILEIKEKMVSQPKSKRNTVCTCPYCVVVFCTVHLYGDETLGLMLQRWSKLEKVYTYTLLDKPCMLYPLYTVYTVHVHKIFNPPPQFSRLGIQVSCN